MTRFSGEVGYSNGTVETPPDSGVWVDDITEKEYRGDVISNTRRQEVSGEAINNDLSVTNSIAIVADDYAVKYFHMIKYVKWAGVYWTVTAVEVRRPRLVLTLGSVYNGPKA